MSAVVVSIAGGQASGKKTVLAALKNRLLSLSNNRLSVATLHQSSFAKPLPSRRPSLADTTTTTEDDEVDRETIDAFDLDGLADAVEGVVKGDVDAADVGGELSNIESRSGGGDGGEKRGRGSGVPDVVLVEGCYVLCHKRLLEVANIKVFVDLDADVRLGWRVLRDTETLSIPLDTVFSRYVRFGKRAFEETIYPTKTLADIILPRGPESAAIDLIAMGVWDDIRARRDEQLKFIKSGLSNLLSVGVGTLPGHFSPARAYSPTRPFVSKSRITIGEADLENFYDSI